MRVFRDGKEVKDAKVIYMSGAPFNVIIDGVNYDARAFEIKDDEPQTKKRATSETPADADTESEAMTTRNTGRRKAKQ